MQKYDFTAPASGASQVVNVPGRYLKYVTGNAGGNDTGLIVTPGGKPGSKILLYPGQAITLPNDGTAGPNAWTIANAIGAGQITGTVVIGNGRIDDNTLQGVVQVADGSKARTIANQAFSSYGSVSAVAAQYSRMQLWNPAASGVRLIVEAMEFLDGPTANSVSILFQSAALATLAASGLSKQSGGTNGKGQLMSDTTAAAPSGNFSFALGTPASTNIQFSPKEPIVLLPGWGLTFWGNTVNAYFGMQLEWYEEPNV
ncbi:hypothetical protein DF107_05755 [Burkholderia stagnalis]|uniref:hypothetical protein n=1 Tax=Burkholderia stagnalis TaxID=1503054 RepID=UPI000F59B674|nr:hypothetical protein [Burkholderia stagnalis]RQQ20789.1 hypothetical protein DF161_03720 [Burkholderia stagnalis]RQY45475.1 hypothetical protein DF113_05370 [Burkholderia stagnalis]RQY84419.1 hypothetical protein DF107_05755 [Burkholderia stagnalis]